MKNSELAQVKGIMKYKEELNKVKPLTQDTYTIAEAAEYFQCARSQVKGYHSNYKDIFGDTIVVEGKKGHQRTIISKDGMYLMAILLSNKSLVARELFNRVLPLVEGEEQITLDETAATVETVDEPVKENKAKIDNVIKFEDIKKAKEDKEIVECLKVTVGPTGIDVSPVKMTKKEAEKLVSETEDKLGHSNSFEEMLNSVAEKILNDILEAKIEDDEKVDTLKSCNCENCSTERLDEITYKTKLDMLNTISVLETQKVITEKYLKICDLLEVDKHEAKIMIQNFIIDSSRDIDNDILNYLMEQEKIKRCKQIGIINESIKLLAEEKYDNLKEAYLVIAQEMRYVLGMDFTKIVEDEQYNKFVESIIDLKEFDAAITIIRQILID